MADFPDEQPTRVTCLACGGRWIIPGASPTKDSRCPWCTAGTMTIEQVRAYRKNKPDTMR